MTKKMKWKACFAACILTAGIALGSPSALAYNGSEKQISAPIEVVTPDGVTVYGEPYFGDLGKDTPLVLLFHQAGANGRGEYASIAKWLNENGIRAIAWDQRSGGDRFGSANRAVASLPEGVETGYCEVYPDLQAAIDYVERHSLSDHVFAWGSSYSAALVFQLAAKNPDKLSGVLAFSPAAGGPLRACRARDWISEVTAETFVLRPASEMARESSQEQRDILSAAGADFFVAENGVHGSSMLVDDRTNHDMSGVRARVLAWLKQVSGE